MRTRAVALGAITAAIGCSALAVGASAKTVWLCKPGQQPDPCVAGLSTTVYSPTLKPLRVEHPARVAHPAIDCFYVYPTVSDQTTGNANLHIDPVERAVALRQAGRYSQYCRVFAPMYRQLTVVGIANGALGKPTTPPNPILAFDDVQAAFETYVKQFNHGRGFVLLGHSQGSYMLRALIGKDIDPKPALRRLMVSAILPGGNVIVKHGKDIGGDFKHIPACHSSTQLGCVIAYSTFDQPPPMDTLFGVPVGPFFNPLHNPQLQALCTNPASLSGGRGVLDPVFPSAPFPSGLVAMGIAGLRYVAPSPATVWWTAPGSYRARCEALNGATVLEITPLHGAQTPAPSPTPQWGLHLIDVGLALGNLVSIVHSEAAAFARSGR
jgi:hypothetical protein